MDQTFDYLYKIFVSPEEKIVSKYAIINTECAIIFYHAPSQSPFSSVKRIDGKLLGTIQDGHVRYSFIMYVTDKNKINNCLKLLTQQSFEAIEVDHRYIEHQKQLLVETQEQYVDFS